MAPCCPCGSRPTGRGCARGPAGTPSSAGRPVRRRSGSWGATAGRC
ncbi:hypothetical protein [Ornithinimicrobium kibberense]